MVIVLFLFWPFAITAIPMWARWTIAAAWWGILVIPAIAVGSVAKGKRAQNKAIPIAEAPPKQAAIPGSTAVGVAETFDQVQKLLVERQELMDKQAALIEAQARQIAALQGQRAQKSAPPGAPASAWPRVAAERRRRSQGGKRQP